MKRYRISRVLILVLLTILFANINIFSQNVLPESLVDVSSGSTVKKTNAGTEIILEIMLSIKNTWHINANKPLEKSLIPTVIKFDKSKDFVVQKIVYPTAKIVNLPFTNNELALYEKLAVVKTVLSVSKKFKGKKLTVKGEVQYQPCSGQTCLFPVSKQFTADIKLK